MEQKPQLSENSIATTPINVPTFIDAQNAKDSDTFERIAVITSASNVNFGDQAIPPPIAPLSKKGIINSGRKNGKKHWINGKLLTERLMKRRRSL